MGLITRKVLSILWLVVSALVLCGTGAIFYRFSDRLKSIPDHWKSVSAFNWLIVGLGCAAYYWLDYFRLYALLCVLGERLRLWAGLKVNAASTFAASLTPTAELHVPVGVFFLSKYGIDVSKATA